MKSICLYANEDAGLDQRLDAALCLADQFDCLVTCVQVTPYDAFIMADPFGGIYALPTVAERIDEDETQHRLRVEDRLKRQRVRWEWQHFEGHVGHVLVQCAQLADLLVLSLPEPANNRAGSTVTGVALHTRTPVLAMPSGGGNFTCKGDVLVAWNGSAEAAYAMRCALPLLKRAAGVHVVTVTGEEDGPRPDEAVHYLLQHGIHAKPHREAGGKSIAEALLQTARDVGAHFIVAGATGHWRLRKAIVGDVTAELVEHGRIPLLLAH